MRRAMASARRGAGPSSRGHTKRLELLQVQRQELTADRLGELVEPRYQAQMERTSQELFGLLRVETFEMNHFIGEDASIVVAGRHQEHGLCAEGTRELHDGSLGEPIAVRKVIDDQHHSPTRSPPARAPHRRGQRFGHGARPRPAVAAEQTARIHHLVHPRARQRRAQVISPERHPRQLRIIDFEELGQNGSNRRVRDRRTGRMGAGADDRDHLRLQQPLQSR